MCLAATNSTTNRSRTRGGLALLSPGSGRRWQTEIASPACERADLCPPAVPACETWGPPIPAASSTGACAVRWSAAAASTTVGALALVAAAATGRPSLAGALLLVMAGLLADARRWLRLAGRSRVGARSEDEVQRALARARGGGMAAAPLAALAGPRGHRLRGDLAHRRSRSRSRRNAPRGALLYPRLSREELEGRFLGPMAYPDPKGERDNSMLGKRWSAQVSGLGCRGTRVIWRKLDCLNPNLQTMQRSVCRKDACDRHHALRRFSSSAVATFGVWSVAQRGQSRR